MHRPEEFASSSAEHPLLSCSMGTAFLLDSFAKLSVKEKPPTFHTVMINMQTLIRNCMDLVKFVDGKIDDKLVLAALDKDVDFLISYISEYNLGRGEFVEPLVIFYIPKYFVPKLHLRTQTLPRIALARITETVYKMLESPIEKAWYGTTEVHVVPCMQGGLKYPHMLLHDYVVKREYRWSSVRARNHLLISHINIDLHLGKFINNLFLMESYTGEIKTKKVFGMKAFSLPSMPFIGPLHLLLGDPTHFTPLAQRGDKKKLIETSISNKWHLKHEQAIMSDIKALNIIPQAMYSTIKFY